MNGENSWELKLKPFERKSQSQCFYNAKGRKWKLPLKVHKKKWRIKVFVEIPAAPCSDGESEFFFEIPAAPCSPPHQLIGLLHAEKTKTAPS